MYYLNDLGLVCNLGPGKDPVCTALLADQPAPAPADLFQARDGYMVGAVNAQLPDLPGSLQHFACRNNRLALAALTQIQALVESARSRYGAGRIGVVMATSTSGIDATESAVAAQLAGHSLPPFYHPLRGSFGGLGEFVAAYLECDGPVYTLSTACSSSGNALLSARRLLAMNLCDAVIVGGVDSLCELTLQGFGALEAQSEQYNRPFSADRDGINIGEAAAVFLLSREPSRVQFLGGAASSDAHHISAPHPEGEGAFRAMQGALRDAALETADVDYLNLHGTGTPQNDAMESKAVHRLFGSGLECSSTKAFTGHCLGAAAALEAGICWLLLGDPGAKRLPPSAYSDQRDDTLAPITLTGHNERPHTSPRICMSNSFAFGGSNVSLLLGRADV